MTGERARVASQLVPEDPHRVHGRNLGGQDEIGGEACWRIHECMAIPAATPTLIERVEPNCAMEHTIAERAQASSLSPGPS